MSSQAPGYYIPEPSRWPIIAVLSAFLIALGTVLWINAATVGPWILATGFGVFIYLLFGWFGQVVGESRGGNYNRQVDTSFRQGMVWFITSEAFFLRHLFWRLVLPS